jgi:hypothetical protein
MSALFQVFAQGQVQTRLGRTCFVQGEAEQMMRELRGRGYAGVYAKRWESSGCPDCDAGDPGGSNALRGGP